MVPGLFTSARHDDIQRTITLGYPTPQDSLEVYKTGAGNLRHRFLLLSQCFTGTPKLNLPVILSASGLRLDKFSKPSLEAFQEILLSCLLVCHPAYTYVILPHTK